MKRRLSPLAVVMVGNRHTYLRAYDILAKIGISRSRAILIVNVSPASINVDIAGWYDVVDVSVIKRLFPIRKILQRLSKYYWGYFASKALESYKTDGIQYFLAAHYDWVSHVSAFHAIESSNKKFIVIDDGMKNIAIEARRKAELGHNIPSILEQTALFHLPNIKKRLIKLASSLLGLNITSIARLYWYTELPLTAFKNDSSDAYIDISQPIKSKSIDVRVIQFIGQPVPNLNEPKKKLLHDLFSNVSKEFNQSLVQYFPHRAESGEQTRIAENYFDIIRPESPFELYFKDLNKYPAMVISFYSSVLFTLHRYSDVGVKFKGIYAPSLFELTENLETVYEAMSRSEHVEVVVMSKF